MKLIIPILVLFTSMPGIAQNNNTITIGNRDSVYSNILHEKRKLWVSMPDTTSPDGIFYPQRYPVVYLLDGDENTFATVAVMLRQMGGGSGNTGFPATILVGIPNTDRNRDLTPTHGAASPGMDSYSASHTGGGENFMSFIEKELMPHIDSSYPTAPYKLLIGHSLGGLTVINALINHTNLFNAYLAIEPSMWWDNQKLLKQTSLVLQQKDFTGRRLYLAMANTMIPGMDTVQVKSDTNFMSLHIRSIMQLGHNLKAGQQNGLISDWKYYPDYNHGSVEMVAEYDGLSTLFKFYGFQMPFGEFFQPGYKADSIIAVHYKYISSQMGYTVSPPEQFISAVCHQLIDMKQFDRALYFINMNMENYPKSANVYGLMGNFYVAKGDKQKARQYYTKALSLRDDSGIKQKLQKLQQAK